MPPSTFEIDYFEVTTHYTYFDTTGRHAVAFFKKNVVYNHEQPILVKKKKKKKEVYSRLFIDI